MKVPRGGRYPQRNVLPHHWGGSMSILPPAGGCSVVVRVMRCTACGAELILTNVVRIVPGVEHHTFGCSECHVAERRVVFTKHGREDDSAPIPMDAAPPTVPTSTVQSQITAPGLFSRVVARIRGH